ncbi:hypothetical protein F4782DRAFT_538250 [Xylaria castorea]|nr:hypothetical protein F4782DRAFT_538250 [Xylaria castorea]
MAYSAINSLGSLKVHDERGQLSKPLLDYGCSHWKTSSQRAADLYDSGVKLWRKEDLVDIEQQVAQSCIAEKFTVRRIDGSIVHIKNPIFGVQNPIWKPYIEFHEYWHLVRSTPDVPPEMYNCTYLVDWINQTLLGGDGNAKKVTKIVCFGLGDMNYKPPDWWRRLNDSRPEDERETEASLVEGTFIHHAIALTIADIIRSSAKTGDTGVRLLTQDPKYTDETKDILWKIGFEVVGEYGAGGFAELDDESVVFSAFASAPVMQIIADLARPVATICPEKTSHGVFHNSGKLYGDPESPRTRQMWKGYESWNFPVPSEVMKLEGSLKQLEICTRIGD